MKIGNLDVNKVMVGSDEIAAIYAGLDLVYSSTPPTPPTPTFNGKWLSTYQGGTTSSAECDSSSAITDGEITKANLVSVEIGDCVTSIGNNALSGCSSITSVTIGSGVTTIGEYAFYQCSGLTSITIPDSVTNIGKDAFYQCSGLTSVTIPDSVTNIGKNTFRDCSSLISVTIGSGVTFIGNSVFGGCSSLTSVTLLATTPPTLGTYVFNNSNNCPIYVPASSLSAYQSASRWSDYSSRIQAIPL